MILLQLDTGLTEKLDPRDDTDLCRLDKHQFHRQIRRVSLLDGNGRRVDLPLNRHGIYRMWIERVCKNGIVKGERFYMKTNNFLIRATLFYSDGRVVFDVNPKGGFFDV